MKTNSNKVIFLKVQKPSLKYPDKCSRTYCYNGKCENLLNGGCRCNCHDGYKLSETIKNYCEGLCLVKVIAINNKKER